MSIKIESGFEFYWPKQNNPVVNTVKNVFTATEYKYRQPVQVEKASFVDDYGIQQTWNLEELRESIDKGFIAPYEREIPHKARKRILTEASPSFIPPDRFFSLLVQGKKVNLGVTTWTNEMTSLVDDEGKLVRKKSIIDETIDYMVSRGFAKG